MKSNTHISEPILCTFKSILSLNTGALNYGTYLGQFLVVQQQETLKTFEILVTNNPVVKCSIYVTLL